MKMKEKKITPVLRARNECNGVVMDFFVVFKSNLNLSAKYFIL